MIKNKRILHLTDFHLHDITPTSKEHFRQDYFEQYLSPLLAIINQIGSIDCLIATGDFIDKGKTNFGNFAHAKKILEFIVKNLKLRNENVGVCIGNHDLDRDLDKEDKFADARKDFYQFASFFSNANSLRSEERFTISLVSDNTYFLALDATLGRQGKDQPGKLSSEEINTITEAIKAYDNPNNLIIIGSHYPLTYFDSAFPTDVDGFFDRHFWRTGELLKDRIQKTIKQSQILWLFGDTHQGAQSISNNQLFVMSGRIGTKVVDSSSAEFTILSRQAKVIEFNPNNETQVTTIEFHPIDKDDDQRGDWKSNNPEPYIYRIDTAELINEEIQKDLILVIKNNNLYKFGRYVINKGQDVSLGWISINALLTESSKDILPHIIIDSRNWIQSKLSENYNYEESLIIGIDFWGSIIASQLSIATGMRNFITGSRGDKKFYSLQEVLESSERELKIENIKNIIFVTDVVSSGRTLESIHNKLVDKFADKGLTIEKYLAIAIISDRKQQKKVNLGFLNAFGTFCSSLRIPVVDIDMLPDEEILPTKKYF